MFSWKIIVFKWILFCMVPLAFEYFVYVSHSSFFLNLEVLSKLRICWKLLLLTSVERFTNRKCFVQEQASTLRHGVNGLYSSQRVFCKQEKTRLPDLSLTGNQVMWKGTKLPRTDTGTWRRSGLEDWRGGMVIQGGPGAGAGEWLMLRKWRVLWVEGTGYSF